jgi:hypothetical protein
MIRQGREWNARWRRGRCGHRQGGVRGRRPTQPPRCRIVRDDDEPAHHHQHQHQHHHVHHHDATAVRIAAHCLAYPDLLILSGRAMNLRTKWPKQVLFVFDDVVFREPELRVRIIPMSGNIAMLCFTRCRSSKVSKHCDFRHDNPAK